MTTEVKYRYGCDFEKVPQLKIKEFYLMSEYAYT